MEKLRLWLALILDKPSLRWLALAYALPLVVLGLSLFKTLADFAANWFWLFLPAVILHGLLALNAASNRAKVAAARERIRQSRVRLSPARVTQIMETQEGTEQLADSYADADLTRLRESLMDGFSRMKSLEGIKALQELVYQYAELQPVIERRKQADSLTVAPVPALVEQTYRQGLSVLGDALELARAIRPSDRERLEAGIGDLKKEIEALRGIGIPDETQAGRIKIREERLASDQERLEMMKQQELRVDQLLNQSDRCGASLHRTRMELAALKADSSETGVSSVTDTLRLTINQAKEVQVEMKKLGF